MKNKKGISEIVGYVLLIVIAVGISVLVYAFLKGYISPPEKNCPANTAIAIEEYRCVLGEQNILHLGLRNSGTFNIDGYIIRVRIQNGTNPVKTITLDDKATGNSHGSGNIRYTSTGLGVGNTSVVERDFTEYGDRILNIEIEPYRIENNEIILCKDAVISQPVDDCPNA